MGTSPLKDTTIHAMNGDEEAMKDRKRSRRVD
jgi:hypothetical protein